MVSSIKQCFFVNNNITMNTIIIVMIIIQICCPSVYAQPYTLFQYRSDPGDWIGNGTCGATSSLSLTYYFNSTPILIKAMGFRVEMKTMKDPPTQGTFNNAVRYPFNQPTEPGLNVVYDGRGCNNITGKFTISSIKFDANGTITSFTADFEQYCERAKPGLYGSIYYNSNSRPTKFPPTCGPQPCVFSQWSAWTVCDDCNEENVTICNQTSTRTIILQEVNGGNCSGNLTQNNIIIIPPCPPSSSSTGTSITTSFTTTTDGDGDIDYNNTNTSNYNSSNAGLAVWVIPVSVILSLLACACICCVACYCYGAKIEKERALQEQGQTSGKTVQINESNNVTTP